MDQENLKFDDEALRQALRRSMPADAAPAQLRQRIQQTLADFLDGEPLRLPQAPAPVPGLAQRFLHGRRLAIAASILGLAGGVAIFHFVGGDDSITGNAAVRQLQPVAFSLAQRHDGYYQDPIKARAHTPVVTREHLTAADAELARRWGRPVPLEEFVRAGWEFHGADDCHLGSAKGTHLSFLRQNQTLSVFLLPASVAGGLPDGTRYASMADGHPVAGMLIGRSLICLVGRSTDGSLTADQLADLLDQVIATK